MKRKAKRRLSIAPELPGGTIKSAVQNDGGFGTSMPPSFTNIEIYFDQKGEREIARDFYDEYASRRWNNVTGQPVRNWKVSAAEWIYNYRQEMKRKFRRSPFFSESF